MFTSQRRITSKRQLQILVEYMGLPDHNDLARCNPSWVRSKEGRYHSEEMWNEIGGILNAEEGTRRTAKEWSKVWTDLKSRVKKSIMFNREKAKQGSTAFIKLSATEEMVAGIIGFTSLDDDDIDQAMIRISRKQSTLMQLHLLAKFMNDNLRVALGPTKKSQERTAHKRYYEQITKVLNKEGPSRSPKEWSKVWIDMKCKVRSKLEKLAVDEHDPSAKLSELDELVAAIVSKNPDEDTDDGSGSSGTEEEEINPNDVATMDQLELLWQHLNDHREMATSAYSMDNGSLTRAWEEIAHKLNAVEDGVVKDSNNWARFWASYKNQLRSKIQRVMSSTNGDGDCVPALPAETYVDDMEGRFLQILGENFGSEGDEGNQSTTECSRKRGIDDHSYTTKGMKPKKIKKQLNANDSDDDYFPENSHTNATLQEFTGNSHRNATLQEFTENSHTNATLQGFTENSHTNATLQEFTENSHTNATLQEFTENYHTNATLQEFTVTLEKKQNQSQNTVCTDCQENLEGENDRNSSFIALLTSELKYIPSCVKSDAFVNILKYVNSLKSKHKGTVGSDPSIYSTFEVLLDNTDPLS